MNLYKTFKEPYVQYYFDKVVCLTTREQILQVKDPSLVQKMVIATRNVELFFVMELDLTLDLQLIAARSDPNAINKMLNNYFLPCNEVQSTAFGKFPKSKRFFHNRGLNTFKEYTRAQLIESPYIQMDPDQNPYLASSIAKQTAAPDKFQVYFVRNNPKDILDLFKLHTPCLKAQLIAVEDKNVFEKMLEFGKQKSFYLENKVICKGLSKHPEFLQNVINIGYDIDESIQYSVLEKDGCAFEVLINNNIEPNENVKKAAILKNWKNIKFIDSPSYELQKIAVKQNDWALECIIKKGIVPTEELILIASGHTYNSVLKILYEGGIKFSKRIAIIVVTKDLENSEFRNIQYIGLEHQNSEKYKNMIEIIGHGYSFTCSTFQRHQPDCICEYDDDWDRVNREVDCPVTHIYNCKCTQTSYFDEEPCYKKRNAIFGWIDYVYSK